MTNEFDHLLTNYQDFPIPGVLFRDISPLLFDSKKRTSMLEGFCTFIKDKNIDAIAGIDARGFVLGSMLAEKYQLPFIMIRKDGKLPEMLVSKKSYSYEYSHATLTIRKDILTWHRVLVADDVLATGWTMKAALDLARENGASAVFGGVIIELLSLWWREKIEPFELYSVLQYD